MLIDDVWFLAAGMALLAGVGAWRRSWVWYRGGAPLAGAVRGVLLLGSGLILGAAVLFHGGMGWDRALTCALFGAGGLGLAAVAAGGRYRRSPASQRSPRRRVPARSPSVASPAPWPQRLRPAWRLILAGPVAGGIAFAGAVLLAAYGPGASADRLIGAGLAAPLLWAGVGCWGLCAHRLGRASVGLSLLLGLLAVPLVWGMI